MLPPPPSQTSWLWKYASNHLTWKESKDGASGESGFKRPLGLVETSFDIDGTYYGGRADMTALFTLAIRHSLSRDELRKRIVLAWTSLRLRHVLLMSRTIDDAETGQRNFVVDVPVNVEDTVRDAEESVVWIEDAYANEDLDIDGEEIYHHALNVGRIISPRKCLSKLFVLPLRPKNDGTIELRFLIIIAHQISDGLSAYNWFSDFIRIFNTPASAIERAIVTDIRPENICLKLPPAQETLYPAITGSVARQRWFWALVRVLRHVKKTLPPTFVNPLRREQRLEEAIALDPKFEKLFDYTASSRPPMSAAHITASLSPAASTRLISLCRAANVSIGAGCFALAGLSMMELHEARYPDVADVDRPPFTAGFPLNPRAFFVNPPAADSCMLAFSEGIVMPFLPSRLPVEGRFRLVAKHANRELRVYQKRLKGVQSEGASVSLDKHSPERLLATGYVASIERVDAKLPESRRSGLSPQGELSASAGFFATCGVSSLGSIAPFFKRGRTDLDDMEEKDLAADFRDLRIGVRARDNEFLVGSSTNAEGIVGFGVSYDMNAISLEAAEMWATKISGILEKGNGSRL